MCEQEHDIYAVAVKDDDTIVGHVPRAISAVCHMFLNKSGTSIHSEIVGNRLWHVHARFNKFLRALCWTHERFKHSDVVLFAIIFDRVKF